MTDTSLAAPLAPADLWVAICDAHTEAMALRVASENATDPDLSDELWRDCEAAVARLVSLLGRAETSGLMAEITAYLRVVYGRAG